MPIQVAQDSQVEVYYTVDLSLLCNVFRDNIDLLINKSSCRISIYMKVPLEMCDTTYLRHVDGLDNNHYYTQTLLEEQTKAKKELILSYNEADHSSPIQMWSYSSCWAPSSKNAEQ